VDYSLSNNFAGVKTTIDGVSASGYTSTRKALKLSIEDVIAHRNPNPKSIQAVILMSDGDFNYYGDPLARGTGYDSAHKDGGWRYYDWSSTYTDRHTYFSGLGGTVNVNSADIGTHQDMSLYAKDNHIRIYTISFGAGIVPGSDTWNTMETLATTTGGKHYHANDGTELDNVYAEIAGELKEDAGVNTVMDLNMGSVNVSGTDMAGSQVFSYVFDDAGPVFSTGRTMDFASNGTFLTLPPLDQTSDWNTNQILHFDIGTVVLNETWTATYKLKVNQTGSIDLFSGPGSKITFNNGEATLNLPHTYLTVSSSLISTGMTMKTIALADLRCTEAGEIKSLLPVAWNTTYNGMKTVTERVYYSIDNGPWVQFDEKTGIASGETRLYAQLDVSKLPPGGYQIKVYATAQDAPDATKMLDAPVNVGSNGRSFIKLE
jgi:hypothetical protein